MNANEDTELIKKAQQGDTAAFEALVNGYYDVMYKMAFKWCGSKSSAEDITQEACIKLARGLESFRHNAKFTSWLYRLVINTARDWVKAQNRHNHGPDGLETVSMSMKEDDKLHAQEVMAAIYKLPEGEKEALLLVFSEGLSHKEAAEILECKESTISWRIHEARKKLGALFEGERNYG